VTWEGRTSEAHRKQLDDGFRDVLVDMSRFAPPNRDFSFADDPVSGLPVPDLILCCRQIHVFAQAKQEYAGAGEIVRAGLMQLQTQFADRVHGGWRSSASTSKAAYDHMFVLLAAASAMTAGFAEAAVLFEDVARVVDRRFWSVDSGVILESFADDWSNPEQYIGGNANMHAVEAFLAAFGATGDQLYLSRATTIAERFTATALQRWSRFLPEHYHPDLTPILDYNADRPDDQLRPYGSTIGHWLEWSRLLVELYEALDVPPSWLLPTASTLFARAVETGWEADGHPGFVYTVDWDGRVSVDSRLHWVLAEAIGAASALARLTGNPEYDLWYQRFWELAARAFVRADGSWRCELDANLNEHARVWRGRPDGYHASAALLSQRPRARTFVNIPTPDPRGTP
jgi:mannose/cellobiose epimerase-like protein (N-acyl-D-glucosamine 2-epimerase family)